MRSFAIVIRRAYFEAKKRRKYAKNVVVNMSVLLLLLLPLSAGPSLEHYRTEYLQGTSEAWLKTGKSDLKTDKYIPQLYLVMTWQPSLEGLQGWRCDDTLW